MMRLPLAKLTLLSVSVLLSFFLVEGVLRVTLNPVNFLRPVLVNDPVLGHRVLDGTGGHDDWGFRNPSVPDQVDVVAIGDSQTYGVSAMAFNSWPAWLSRTIERPVYNMGLGGWGPVQYEVMLSERALPLKPKTIVMGVYLGNDIFDSYRVVYGLSAWAKYRRPEASDLVYEYKGIDGHSKSSALVKLRTWIGRHSVLYRLTVTTFGQLLGRLELSVRDLDPSITMYEDDERRMAFTPVKRLKGVSRETAEVREGIRLTKEIFGRMIALCEENEIRLVAVSIPTKESIFEDLLSGQAELANYDAIAKLLADEASIRDEMRAFFEERGVEFVDPRVAMRTAAETTAIYPSNEGGHPVSAGYRVIAESIAQTLLKRPH